MKKFQLEKFHLENIKLTKYLFFTGKGGVGKTSTACSVAVSLADKGKKVVLVSTDPASNLQDVFEMELDNKITNIKNVSNLFVANFNPEDAARDYRETVLSKYIGKLPDAVIKNMEEQLSGSCTVEIAAFNEFTNFITDKVIVNEYDYIIFDTAPTGHTLRMLQLPSAWSNFISESTHGASCLGQLSRLEDKKEMYKFAVEKLIDSSLTSLILVSRPEETPLKEAERASIELRNIGINNQLLIINGVLESGNDKISKAIVEKQKNAIENMPEALEKMQKYFIPLRSYNILGIDSIRNFLNGDEIKYEKNKLNLENLNCFEKVIEDLYSKNKKIIFTMGKGGVGKTTIAATIALGLAEKGKKVHLTTTDPAAHLKFVLDENSKISISHIDEKLELEKYKNEVLSQAKKTMSESDIEYIKEDLRSPCTQEIAVFKAFAEIVAMSEEEVVVIDTAPTGHTLLLLDSTENYNKEILRSQGNSSDAIKNLLPKLKDKNHTEVIIVTLAEATPVYEALRLSNDLERADIYNNWWVINSSLYASKPSNETLNAKADSEIKWINKVDKISNGNFVVIEWISEDLKGENLKKYIKNKVIMRRDKNGKRKIKWTWNF